MGDELNQKIPGPEKEIKPEATAVPVAPEKEKPATAETEPAVFEKKVEESPVASDPGGGGGLPKPTGKSGVATPTPIRISPQEKEEIDLAVKTAFNKGIDEAVEQVRRTQNAHLIDAFHDLLVDELYQRLVQSGKLKKE